MTSWMRRLLARTAGPVAAVAAAVVLAAAPAFAAPGADASYGPSPAVATVAAEPAAPGPPSAQAPDAPGQAARRLLVMLNAPPVHARLDGGYGGGYGDAVQRRTQVRVAARIAAAHGLGVITQWPMPVLHMDCVVMTLPAGLSMDDAIREVQGHPEVAWAQPMNEFTAQGHVDPLYTMQPTAALWHLDELHAVATGRRVRVAIVDSGVDAAHPDLAHQLDEQVNFVDGQDYRAEQHGTAVAGLVAARADNGLGIVGVAPDARLVSLRACWQNGTEGGARTVCDSLSLAKALHHAIEHPAEIINMSLSGPPDPLIGRLIDAALARRQLVVAAVDPVAPGGGFPASHAGVIAVRDAATPVLAGEPAESWRAPARDLPTTVPGGGWRLVTGTSFAAAQVSGLLALVEQLRMADPARATPAAARLVRSGDGGIDACASLAAWSGRRGGAAGASPAVFACHGTVPMPVSTARPSALGYPAR
jgi:subtilisin family serine protease